MDIEDWRKKIDQLDEQIVKLISRRAEAAQAIGEIKRTASSPVYEPKREQAVFEHVSLRQSRPSSPMPICCTSTNASSTLCVHLFQRRNTKE